MEQASQVRLDSAPTPVHAVAGITPTSVFFSVRTILSTCLTLLLIAPAARAQIVRGVVADQESGSPLPGAMVVLMAPDSTPVDRFLTRDDGTFVVDARLPGRFLVRVDRIGYATLTTEPFDVPIGGTFRAIQVPVRPIRLRGLDVAGARRCEVRPEEGAVTAQVWNEARKALEAAAWTQETGVYRYTLLHFERVLDRDAKEMVDEQRSFSRGSASAPFVSTPAAELVTEGFVRPSPDGGTVYHAPDAEAFLSDEFLDTHCLGVERGRDGMIGLTFEPVAGRTTTDIEGLLWIDPANAQLDRIDFSYVNLVDDPEVGDPGGEVHFTRLPNGTWIVREWWIRMPVLALTDEDDLYRTGYRDEGGVAWRVSSRSGDIVLEASTVTLTGIVQDSIQRSGAQNVEVRLHPGGERFPVDERGSFLIAGLPGGFYQVTVQHAALDTLGLPGPIRSVDASQGPMIHLALEAPRVGSALQDACGESPRPRDTAPLLGRVLDGSGTTRSNIEVIVSWTSDGFTPPRVAAPVGLKGEPALEWEYGSTDGAWTLKTHTDGRGIFLLCDVPYGSRPRIEVRSETGAATSETPTVRNGADVALVVLTLDQGR